MGRFLVLVIIVVLAFWLIRRALSKAASRGKQEPPPEQGAGELVTCAHCGVHLPRSEARPSGDTLYCSEEHARLGPGASK